MGYAQTFPQAIEMVKQGYNYLVLKPRVKRHLNLLHVSDFISKGDEVSATLCKLYRMITRSYPGISLPLIAEMRTKVEFPRNAMVGFGWSHEPLRRVGTHGISFQMLHGELKAALQLDKEEKVVLAGDSTSSASTKTEEVGITYAEHGSYGRNAKSVRSNKEYSRNPSAKTNPLDIAGYLNCDALGHLATTAVRAP